MYETITLRFVDEVMSACSAFALDLPIQNTIGCFTSKCFVV